MKVILTAGFSGTTVDGDNELPSNTRLLRKPYRRDELARCATRSMPWTARDEPAATRMSTTDHRAARQLLIVEDAPDYRRLATAMREGAGMQVFAAANVAEAMATLERARAISLLLIDIGLPPATPHGLSVGSVALRMRANVKVIYRTGAYDLREFALFSDDLVVLTKPFTAAELLDVVGVVCADRPAAKS